MSRGRIAKDCEGVRNNKSVINFKIKSKQKRDK